MKAGIFMLLQRPSGEFLLQLRDDGRGRAIMFPNTWVFPGGVKEAGEDYLETVVREAKEEFDIDLSPIACKRIMIFNYDGTEDTHVYLCPVADNQKPVLKEGAAWRWMALSEVEKLDLGFGQNRIIPSVKKAIAHGVE